MKSRKMRKPRKTKHHRKPRKTKHHRKPRKTKSKRFRKTRRMRRGGMWPEAEPEEEPEAKDPVPQRRRASSTSKGRVEQDLPRNVKEKCECLEAVEDRKGWCYISPVDWLGATPRRVWEKNPECLNLINTHKLLDNNNKGQIEFSRHGFMEGKTKGRRYMRKCIGEERELGVDSKCWTKDWKKFYPWWDTVKKSYKKHTRPEAQDGEHEWKIWVGLFKKNIYGETVLDSNELIYDKFVNSNEDKAFNNWVEAGKPQYSKDN